MDSKDAIDREVDLLWKTVPRPAFSEPELGEEISPEVWYRYGMRLKSHRFFMEGLKRPRRYHAWARAALGNLYEGYGNLTDTWTHYEATLAFQPGFAIAQEGLERLARQLSALPRNGKTAENLKTLNDEGLALLQEHKVEEALELFNKAARRSQHYELTWGNLARARLMKGDRAGAAVMWVRMAKILFRNPYERLDKVNLVTFACQRAIQADPNIANAWVLLGDSLRVQKRFLHALTAVKKAVSLNPTPQGAWYLLGILHYILGDFASSVPAFEQDLLQKVSNPHAKALRDNARRKLGASLVPIQTPIYLRDNDWTYPEGIVGDCLPPDIDCSLVKIHEYVEDGSFLIDFALGPWGAAGESKDTLAEQLFDTEGGYEFDRLFKLIRPWRFEQDYIEMPTWFYIYLFKGRHSRERLLSKVIEIVTFHAAEIQRLEEKFSHLLLTSAERAYYKETWGFDPIFEQCALNDAGTEYRYSKRFQLDADPGLQASGIILSASVDVTADGVHNWIVFERGDESGEIHCTHTVVYGDAASRALTYAEDEKLKAGSISQDEWIFLKKGGGPIKLPAIEHYVALKSYVAAIAELGIEKLLLRAYEDYGDTVADLPFGLNSAMQHQMVKALAKVAPKVARSLIQNVILHLASTASRVWFLDHGDLLESIFGMVTAFSDATQVAARKTLAETLGISMEDLNDWFDAIELEDEGEDE